MMRRSCLLLSVLAGSAPCLAAGPATRPSTRPAPKSVAIGQVRLDVANRQVWLDAEVCLRQGVLEFLMVGWQTKTHESILHTRAKASDLHLALLMLALTPGKPARWSGEDEDARFLPPAGAGLKITLTWKDAKGRPQQADAGTWLRGAGDKQFDPPKEWIFVGSEVLPDGRYWAELEGEIISVTNFASAVIDVPFRSSNADAEREIYADTRAIPPLGTKVRVIVTPLSGAEKAPHARRMLEIDRFGRMWIDGKELWGEKLQQWAAKYLEQHDRGQVVIRAAARALVQDIEVARMDLRLGGVREFVVQRVPAEEEILPRTPEQAQRALKDWEHKFAHAEDYIREPGQQARGVLDQIDLDLQHQQARMNMLKEYAAHLRQAVQRYQASTQPAAKGSTARE
jgi:hypothetical protein